MTTINPNVFKNWQDGDLMTAAEYKQERTIIVTAINGTDTQVTVAQNTANGAQQQAQLADAKAVAAQNTANTALTNAATAQTTANTALTNAATAQTTANLANTNIEYINQIALPNRYTKAETYSQLETATFLAAKADVATTYTKSQTDQKISQAIQGLDMKDSVYATTTSNIPNVVYTGSQFTVTISTITLNAIFDNANLSLDNRYLVKNQQDAKQNGFYKLTNINTSLPTYIWTFTRVDLLDGQTAQSGVYSIVETGQTNADTMWVLTTDGGVVGSTDLIFQQLPGAGAVTAGTGIIVNNQQVSVDTNIIATVSNLQDVQILSIMGVY